MPKHNTNKLLTHLTPNQMHIQYIGHKIQSKECIEKLQEFFSKPILIIYHSSDRVNPTISIKVCVHNDIFSKIQIVKSHYDTEYIYAKEIGSITFPTSNDVIVTVQLFSQMYITITFTHSPYTARKVLRKYVKDWYHSPHDYPYHLMLYHYSKYYSKIIRDFTNKSKK